MVIAVVVTPREKGKTKKRIKVESPSLKTAMRKKKKGSPLVFQLLVFRVETAVIVAANIPVQP